MSFSRHFEDQLGEKLEERGFQGRSSVTYTDYADDPVGFIEEVLGGELWEKQVAIARAVRQEPLVTVRSCHAAGKDWVTARLTLWWCYARMGLVVLTGPTAEQVEEILMRGEVREAFHRSDLPGELHVRALRPGGDGRAGILAKTANGVSALTGFHEERVLFVITEAQDPEIDHAWDAAFACTTGSEDRILTLGNPIQRSGRFYNAHASSSNWRSVKIAASDVPNVQNEEEVVPGLLTREGVERFASEYGESSGFYQSRVLGEFPKQAQDGLFRRNLLEEAAERWRLAREGRFAVGWQDEEPVLGVDPARYGRDPTVVAVRKGPVLVRIESWEEADIEVTAARVAEIAAEAGCERDYGEPGYRGRGLILTDTVGVGAGVHDVLADDWRVRSFKGSRTPSGRSAKRRFRKVRAEAHWTLRDRLAEGQIALPDDDELFRELLAVRWSPDSQGRVTLESKKDMKSRLGRSPDRADAVVMAFYVDAARKKRRIVRFTSTS